MVLGGVRRRVCLTLGALAEIETGLGVEGLAAAAERNLTLVAGIPERQGEALYNAALLARPDGTWARYRKVHLFWDEETIFDAGDLGFGVHE
ncbi:MAG: hypothetical protein KJ911_15670, partial [Alphaproteobacteria bacterium]|nr:hypothetical protein [Alphaproteobacteria bacterium]